MNARNGPQTQIQIQIQLFAGRRVWRKGGCLCTCLLPQAASPPALKRAPLTCHSGHILKHILAILLLINGLKFVAVQYGRKVLSTGEGAG